MFLKYTLFTFVLVGTSLLADDALPGPGEKFKSPKEKTSYALGMDIGISMKSSDLDIDLEAIVRGMRDVMGDAEPLLSETELRETLSAFQEEIQKKAMEQLAVLAEKSKKDGAAFLAANKSKPGVVSLPSGLQYKITRRGSGPIPAATDTVRTHYRGTLLDGTVFDSSYERGAPAEFAVAGVIRGWTEALQRMPVGSKWTLYVPSQLAYGERGAGGSIGPHATLVFEIELLEIVK